MSSDEITLQRRTSWSFKPTIHHMEQHIKVFSGERASMWSFFYMFGDIIFRIRGSVLTAIWIEVLITMALSTIAVECSQGHLMDSCQYGQVNSKMPAEPVGHQIVGTLLAFLVVFRSQIALNMYLEGRAHLGRIMSTSKFLALEILAPLAHSSVIVSLPLFSMPFFSIQSGLTLCSCRSGQRLEMDRAKGPRRCDRKLVA